MEYLATYGWAILIVAIVAAALFALGLFGQSSSSTPNTCNPAPLYSCTDPVYTLNGISVSVGQNTGQPYFDVYGFIVSSNEHLNGTTGLPINYSELSNSSMVFLAPEMGPGETVTLNYENVTLAHSGAIPVGNVPVGNKFTGSVWIGYCTVQDCGPVPTDFIEVGTVSASEAGSAFSGAISSSPTTTSTSTSSTSSTISTTSSTSTSTSSSTSTTSIQQCTASGGYTGGVCNGNVVFDASTVLSSDVEAAGSITINGGVTVTTNGHNFLAGTTFSNSGTINAGNPSNGAGCCGNGGSATSSYGGSGGGGAATSGCCGPSAGSGGDTIAIGGGSNPNTAGSGTQYGGSGTTASQPVGLTSSEINTWYTSGMQNYLEGAGGGGAGSGGGGDAGGGSGSYGLYIQATTITTGTINLNGQNGSSTDDACNGTDVASAGSGGGGSLLLAYQSSYTASGVNVSGGSSAYSQSCNGAVSDIGGSGGSGITITYQYSTPPVTIP
jgi:hypothetical protein